MRELYAVILRPLGEGEYTAALSTGGVVNALSMLGEEFTKGNRVGIIESKGSYFIFSLGHNIDSVVSIPRESKGAFFELNRAQAAAAYIGFLTNKVVELFEVVRVASRAGNIITVVRKGSCINVKIKSGLGIVPDDIEVGEDVIIGLQNLTSWAVVGLAYGLSPFLNRIQFSVGFFVGGYNPSWFGYGPIVFLRDSEGNLITSSVTVTVEAGFHDVFNELGGGRGFFYPLYKSFDIQLIESPDVPFQFVGFGLSPSKTKKLFYNESKDSYYPFLGSNTFRYTYDYGGKTLMYNLPVEVLTPQTFEWPYSDGDFTNNFLYAYLSGLGKPDINFGYNLFVRFGFENLFYLEEPSPLLGIKGSLEESGFDRNNFFTIRFDTAGSCTFVPSTGYWEIDLRIKSGLFEGPVAGFLSASGRVSMSGTLKVAGNYASSYLYPELLREADLRRSKGATLISSTASLSGLVTVTDYFSQESITQAIRFSGSESYAGFSYTPVFTDKIPTVIEND